MTVPMGNNSAKKYSYYYDKEGRQVGMDVEAVSVTSNHTLTAGSSGSNTRFFYDNSKNRVKLITKSGDAYYFVYDPTASIPAVVYEAVGNTAYLNVREPGGSLINREKYTGGVYQYSRTYHFDGLGSTIALTDGSGATTDTYSYDAWGNVTPGVNNQTTDNPYQYVGQYGYYTHYQDPDFKLLQLGVRYYDSSVGRFTQLDPIKDGVNWYVYADNNLMLNIDPTGLSHIVKIPTYDRYDMDCWRDCYGYLKAKDAKNEVPENVVLLAVDTYIGCKIGTGPAFMIGVLKISVDHGYESEHYVMPCCAFCQQRYRNGHGEFNKAAFEHWQRGVKKGMYNPYPIVRWIEYLQNDPWKGEIIGAPPGA